MSADQFVPHHMNADIEDFKGNGKWGRYIILPGSDGRAAKLASTWKNVREKKHQRAHNLYLGTMTSQFGDIEMATISTGMGAPSADIIINELRRLGAKNFIRIGTAGSLQHKTIRRGAIVIPTGSVRDESTTSRYLPLEVPSMPSLDFLIAAKAVEAERESQEHPVFFGSVHSKDSLYAREFLAGPKSKENEEYMQVLKDGGVLASEMETSILFTLGGIFRHDDMQKSDILTLTGAVLAIIGDDQPFGDKVQEEKAVDESINFTLRSIEMLHGMRLGKVSPKITVD